MDEALVAPAELYDEEAIRRLGRFGLSDEFEREIVGVTMPLERGTELVAYLDSLHDTDLDAYFAVKHALTYLPPATILRHYGEEGLAYVAATAKISDIKAELVAATGEHLGYDTELFDKARLWNWHNLGKYFSHGGNVIAQYKLFEYIMRQSAQDIDLPTHLRQSAKPDIKIRDERAADYGLAPIRAVKNSLHAAGKVEGWRGELKPGLFYDVWLDAPVGLMLTYKDEPQALVGLSEHEDGSLFINQLQGIRLHKVDSNRPSAEYVQGRKSARGLAPLDWQKLLLGIAAEVARNTGIDTVTLQAGANNEWTEPQRDGEDAHITVEQAEKAYDRQAARFGFTHDAPKGDWQISTAELLQATSANS